MSVFTKEETQALWNMQRSYPAASIPHPTKKGQFLRYRPSDIPNVIEVDREYSIEKIVCGVYLIKKGCMGVAEMFFLVEWEKEDNYFGIGPCTWEPMLMLMTDGVYPFHKDGNHEVGAGNTPLWPELEEHEKKFFLETAKFPEGYTLAVQVE